MQSIAAFAVCFVKSFVIVFDRQKACLHPLPCFSQNILANSCNVSIRNPYWVSISGTPKLKGCGQAPLSVSRI